MTSGIRTYQATSGTPRRIDFDKLQRQDRTVEGLSVQPVTEDRFQAELQRLIDENVKAAQEGQAELEGHVVPKDASVNPEAFVMAYDQNDEASFGYIAGMAAVGQVEGFRVLARCEPTLADDLQKLLSQDAPEVAGNVTVLPSFGVQDVWTEDHGEYTTDGGAVLVPAMASGTELYTTLALGRLKRLYPEVDLAEIKEKLTQHNLDEHLEAYPMATFPYHGMVQQLRTNEGMLGGVLVAGVPKYRMAVSYVEGGNFLPGRKPDGTPFALVGKDSVAVTETILENDRKKRPDDRQILEVIANDYGLKAGEVIPVEQPGDFHIDMSMTLAAPGQVLLNDSMAVFEQQIKWVTDPEELQTLENTAKFMAEMEALSERDLKAAGLDVHRFAGVFPPSSGNPAMNFFNIRQGVNEEGERFAVLMGGTSELEDQVARTLLHEIPTGYKRIHFLPSELTGKSLELFGGLKCRTKGLV